MSVMVIVEAKTNAPDEMEALLRAELASTRAYEGCEGLTVHRNLDDSNNLVFVQRWESRPHYEKYLAWREERGDLDKLGAMMEGSPNIRFFSTMGV